MLVKEYRILLPLTVEEYRIAQLYMIQKKSRLDSHGAGSGVEIITNRPYDGGPGGSGQYTYKIYHIGNKIPVWIRSVLPTSALEAHEEAWNAYPYTKTRYSSPMMDRFSIEVETVYRNDAGTSNNVFQLSGDELKTRVIDVMNFVKDPYSSHDYCAEEDPKLFRSDKTGRGPLNDDWVEECVRNRKPVMCAYKLCKVEFRYWGMQTRAEKWIHDLALRNTMLRAHRQAWAWQDEWYGLTINDIRRLEAELALHLSEVMAPRTEDEAVDGEESAVSSDEEYFDCTDLSPPHSHKPSIIRWSSELLLNEVHQHDDDSPPLTPALKGENAALLQTLETLITRHYPQLRERVHVLLVACGGELAATAQRLSAVAPSFGALHPSLSLILSQASTIFSDAVEGAIRRANEVYNEFIDSQPGFNGEVFCVGDAIGGLLLYELLCSKKDETPQKEIFSRTGSRVGRTPSTGRIPLQSNQQPIEEENAPPPVHANISREPSRERPIRKISGWSLADFNYGNEPPPKPPHSAGPSVSVSYVPQLHSKPRPNSLMRKKMSIESSCPGLLTRLAFQPSTAFLVGCPLGLSIMQRGLSGQEIDQIESVQVFNLYYPLDPCGARLEPVLNSHLSILPPANIPRYQRYPLGDGRSLHYDTSIDTTTLWGSKRIDHLLYCPNAMVALPSTALPNILHASYWESCDVGAFIIRQFVRGEDSAVLSTLSSTLSAVPLKVDLPPMQWKKRRTRFKITNLSPNHRANDVLVVSGAEQSVFARFCYGPMDLVALTRETVSIFVCPSRSDWFEHSTQETDSNGRLHVSLGNSLPFGIHSIKMVVHGDHSYLDVFLAVVPPETRIVVFSIDGSLTASVSVTGKDPRVRPGAVDVVRYWHDQGFLIVYVTARPDMQQRVVSAWLAQHNFPHALLFFTPSFSTDPLKAKTSHLRHLIDMGVRVHAAYGSSKDVSVYTTAGIDPSRVVSVSGGKRRGTLHVDHYSAHLADLTNGTCPLATGVRGDGTAYEDTVHHHHGHVSGTANATLPASSPASALTAHRVWRCSSLDRQFFIPPLGNVQRTSSFTPRSGKRLNIPLNNVSFFVAPRQTMGQANSFTIESQVFVWTEWGGVVISSDESPCFDLYAEYAQKINMSTVKFNYKPSIFSHSFFLQSNAAKQEYDHYFPAAWRVIHEYFKYPESFDDLDNKLDNATLTLQQTLIWLKGIVPAMCTRKCRVLDDKEIKYVCRLLLIKKICRAAGYEVTEAKHSNKMTDRQRILKNEKKVERNKEWTKKREQKDQAIELERLIFGGEIVPEEDRASPRLWVHAMVKALISWKKPFPNDLPIEAKDLKDRRHIVNKYWETPVPEEMEIRPTDSSIIIWLMHIGKAVEDFNENLCQKDSPKPTIELWNERFITLRSPERCRQNVLDFSNQAVIPALLLSFDDGHLDHLLIHFTRFYNNKDVHFGRIPISLIGQLRKWAIVKEKQTEEVRGLRAFFCQGYPSNFRHILQAGSLRIGDGTSAFLYKSDALPNDNQLAVSKAIFESRPTIVNENHEIDPLFGKPRIMAFPSPNPIFIQEPEFSKLTITDPKKDTSQDLNHKIPVPNHPKPEIVEPTSPNQSYPVNVINPQVSPAYPNVYVAPPTGYHPHHPTPVQQLAGYSPIASFQQSPPFINYPSNQFQYLPYEWTVPAAPNYPGYLQPSPAPQSNHSAQSSGEYLDPQNRNGQLGYQSPPSVYHSPPSAYQSPNAFDANMIPGDLSPRNQTLF
ncbi:unnamed protein product, partial [Mesorhabditis belari]|uniref:DDHD domain-containing protein n=1 Tax=Mesorhabditis belari TaxID=2138241 RepID=A0AAF3E8K2_9BILA